MFKKIQQGLITMNNNNHSYNTRNRNKIFIEHQRLSKTQRNPNFIGAKIYNGLPDYLTNINSLNTFKKQLKIYLDEKCSYSYNEYFSPL